MLSAKGRRNIYTSDERVVGHSATGQLVAILVKKAERVTKKTKVVSYPSRETSRCGYNTFLNGKGICFFEGILILL